MFPLPAGVDTFTKVTFISDSCNSALSLAYYLPTHNLASFLLQGMEGRPKRFDGILDCIRKTVRANGFKGLYKGIGPNFLKAVPAISISYLVYEKTSRYLNRTFKT